MFSRIFLWFRMLHNVLPHGILGGSPAHEEHHNGGRRHYQQFFLYLDYLIGAVEKDVTDKGVEQQGPSLRSKSRGNSLKNIPVMPVN